jgi:hypothetical protein
MKREDFLRSIAVDPEEVKRQEEERAKAEAAKRAAEYRASLSDGLRAKTLKTISGTTKHWTGPPVPTPKRTALASGASFIDRDIFKPGYVPSSKVFDARKHHEPDDLDEPMEYEIRGTKSKLFDEATGRRFVAWVIEYMRDHSRSGNLPDVARRWLEPYACRFSAEQSIDTSDLEVQLEFSNDSATKLITGNTRWAHRFKYTDFY